MPIIGVKGVVISGAVLHLALGIGYLGWPTERAATFRVARLATAVGVSAVVATIFFVQLDPSKLSSGVFRHGYSRQAPDSKVLLLKHGKTATVSLVDIQGKGQISIATNGKPDASIMMRGDKSGPDEITMVMAGAMPLALHPNAKRIANIGIGSGLTTHVLLASGSVETVDTVEIEPYMAQAAEIGFMPRVQRTFRDPRSHIYFEDAKTFFAVHRKKYDVIVSEPSNPWVSGVATLFSEEFYRQITNYLEPDGLLIQWIQTYETDIDIVISVIKALAPQFEDFALYNTDDTNVLIVAARRGTLPLPDARVFDSAAMKVELQRVGITSVRDFDGRFLGNKALFMPLLHASGTPANSDYFPFVDLNAPRARILKRSADELSSLASLPLPFFDLLDGSRQARAPSTLRADSYLERDFLMGQALALREGFNDPNFKGLTPEASRVLMTLRSTPAICSQPVARHAWLDSVYFISARTSGVLDPHELSAMWAEISKTPCAQVLSGGDQQLFDVLRALAQRDVDRVAATGSALFASGYEFDDATKMTTVLIATAACQIANGKKAEALKLLQAHATQPEIAPAFGLAQRWVTAIAAEPANRVADVPTP
jgi:spermidine synthase